MPERLTGTNGFITDRRALLLGAGLLGVAGCAARPPSPETTRLPQTQAVLDRYVADGLVPGATVGLQLPDDSEAWLQAGTQDHGASPAMNRDTLFRIYSMTKPVTGTAAALLIEDGKLTLDQPVTDFVPEFERLTVAIDPAKGLEARPATQTMTIRHLLTHTSGLTYNIMGDGPVQKAYRRAGVFPFTGELGAEPGDGPKVRDLDEMVRRLGEIPLLFEPGTDWDYSVSLDVMGLVVQRASGMPFPDFLQRRLFDPIGMDDTIWRLRRGDAGRLAAVYDYAGAGRRPAAGASAEAYSAPVTLFAGGAGLVSSTRDYLAFMTTLLADGRAGRVQVMKPETARLVRTNILPAGIRPDWGPEGGFGFGGLVVNSSEPNAGEYGWSGAAGTNAWLDPTNRMAGVIMVQFFNTELALVRDVREAIAADWLGTRA
ncbi:CubicO group peptidase (beta-lactamase class C family) [Brevundimonas alba]|uniref:CubicO group peptidase (Beta-lactamase class C family) n=1 Tax=Brevundimonas alba TaxID=74314 RepID=A0A7X6BP10_9CAUL|nr:serine hydrolase domain-containing protein [Brevundimonas alba]NJC41962.1 CubicO group peptidase (beta-lactamase class C family) [Brevundimonas alba]